MSKRIQILSLLLLSISFSCNSIIKTKSDSNSLPTTKNYDLNQAYTDSAIGFSIYFPNEWQLVPNFQGTVLMGTGSYTMNENLEMLNRGGFDIKIRTLEKDYSYKT
jgi:hypothetical protein